MIKLGMFKGTRASCFELRSAVSEQGEGAEVVKTARINVKFYKRQRI